MKRWIKKLVDENSFIRRYFLDVPFQIFVNLIRALGINLIFALIKVFYAVKYSSGWFGALAVYYLALCGIRLFLIRRVRRKMGEEEYSSEWRDYFIIGLFMLGLNIAVTGCVVQMIRDGRGYEYPGVLIYAVAAYTFYGVVMSVYNAIDVKKHKSPVLSAVRLISLSTTAVTVFNLQTALLAQFGDDANFSQLMNMAIGTSVCALILGTAFYMLVRAGIHLMKSSR